MSETTTEPFSTEPFPSQRSLDVTELPGQVAERFRVRRALRRTATTMTVLATDRATGKPVVVKAARIDGTSRANRIRLLHEAEVLRRLADEDAGIVALVDVGETDGWLHLAMPYLPGSTLAARLSAGPLTVDETLHLAIGLFAALDRAHRSGVLHRDIKPSNLILSDADPPVVHVVDWGLARTESLHAAIRDEPVGTAAYMSPEQAGLLRVDVDERSDLYAAGVVLHECLAGKPPFTGATVGELLRAHLNASPPDLRAVAGVPALLAKMVQRLLAKEPRDRYQTAAGVLADVRELQRRLAAEPEPEFVLGTHDVRRTLTEPTFVGRGEEIRRLLKAVTDAQSGRGGLLLVEAESGGGKSRLLDEALTRLPAGSVLVLRGQGVDQGARGPFHVLDGVAADLVDGLDPDATERIRGHLEPLAPALAQALPALARWLGAADRLGGSLGPEEFGEARTIAALTALFDAVGQPERPALIVLDDCQWADEATVKLLARWARDAAAGTHTAVVAAFRSEEVGPQHRLRRTSPRVLRLRPLTEADMATLVESMAGEVPQAILDTVRRLGEGSPFLAAAVLRGLAESGALFHDGQRWRVDRERLADAQSSQRAAGFLVRRLELLDAEVLRLLAAAAVIGKRFDVDLAADLAGIDPDEAAAMLHRIRHRHLVWLDRAEAVFVHDKIREALLERLDVSERRRLHAAAAQRLSAGGGGSAYELAFHYHAAGDDAAALPHALAAAAEARARHALSTAEQQYRIARAGVATDDAATRYEVETGLGQVLLLQGRYAEAEACLAAAFPHATTDAQRAEIERQLGELAFKRGAIPESMDRLEQALRRLGHRVPTRRWVFVIFAVWEGLVQVAHTVLPRRLIQRRRLEGAEEALLAARLYSRLAYSYWFGKGRAPTGWAHLREMNLLERYPPTLELAQAYSEHAPVMTTLPWFSRGIAYAERSLAIRRSRGDIWGQGQSLHFYGVVLYSAARFREAIDKLTEAIRLLERTGDQWEINTALWHIGFAHYRLGEYDAARDALRRCLASADEIGDHQARAIALSGLSKISGGAVDLTAIDEALDAVAGDLHTTGELITGKAIVLLRQGRTAEAATLLEEGHRRVVRAGVRNEYVAPILPWLATALRIQAESASPYRPRLQRRLVRRAWRVGWRARLVATAYPANLPHALRCQALIALLRGRPRRAERLIRRGIAVARRLEMTGERLLLEHLAGELAGGALRPVRLPFDEPTLDEGANLSLADRFENLLTVGRSISAALTAESVYEAVRRAALELLRGDEASVVLVGEKEGEHWRLQPLEASSSNPWAEPLIHRALADGVATWSDADATAPGGAPVPLRTRSALAAPIYVRGRPVACWYVSHSRVGTLFGPDEERLAGFVSTLAGVALENAEGFAAAKALSDSLERRVAERTAELERANAELRHLDELKSEFVAMASHELRSPLTSMLGYCRTALRHWDRIDDERKHEFFDTVARQGERLAALVNDLLQMSRIESGALETTPVTLPVRQVVDDVVADFMARSAGIEVDVDPGLTVVADRDHLRRMLVNLVDNALKYGAPPVRVRAQPAGERIEISVRDHGPGVPADFVPRIFERFAQASAGTTRRASGTGLGMSIVRGLAEVMGGSVSYRSPDGGGAEFLIDLPRGQDASH